MNVRSMLETAGSQIDKIDAEILLSFVLNLSRATLRSFPERELEPEQKNQYKQLVLRRQKGEPVAYLLGHKEFWSLNFIVSPDVLIPRPDTELLVELALENIPTKKTLQILDLGTGSGAVALAIASERSKSNIVATDVSAEALQIAKLNAKQLHISNVKFHLGNWFEALSDIADDKFDMVVSNPPYVASFDPHLVQGDLRFEPNRALVSGPEGMDDLKIIINNSSNYLAAGGKLMVEHGYNQEQLVAQEFKKAGFQEIECFKDLSGIPRVTVGTVPI